MVRRASVDVHMALSKWAGEWGSKGSSASSFAWCLGGCGVVPASMQTNAWAPCLMPHMKPDHGEVTTNSHCCCVVSCYFFLPSLQAQESLFRRLDTERGTWTCFLSTELNCCICLSNLGLCPFSWVYHLPVHSCLPTFHHEKCLFHSGVRPHTPNAEVARQCKDLVSACLLLQNSGGLEGTATRPSKFFLVLIGENYCPVVLFIWWISNGFCFWN